MVINFHEHPGKWAEEHQREFGFDLSVLLPVGEENQRVAIEQVSANPERFVAFFWPGYAEQWDTAADRLKCLLQQAPVRGVKFQPLLQHGFPDDRRLYRMYELCCEHGLIVLTHCGIVGFRQEFGRPHLARFANTVPSVDQLAADFPELKIVIAHLGGNFIDQACIVAAKHENVYLDTSYLFWFAPRLLPPTTPQAMVEHAAAVAGAGRLVYGFEGVPPSVVRQTSLSWQEQEAILGGNAARLLGLK